MTLFPPAFALLHHSITLTPPPASAPPLFSSCHLFYPPLHLSCHILRECVCECVRVRYIMFCSQIQSCWLLPPLILVALPPFHLKGRRLSSSPLAQPVSRPLPPSLGLPGVARRSADTLTHQTHCCCRTSVAGNGRFSRSCRRSSL